MNFAKLTIPAFRAHKPLMERARYRSRLLVLLGTAPMAACITLEAPDEPIVIELNINITQEVLLRLADDAGTTLDENADIF